MVMPNLYKLADTAYANNHQFFLDGSPNVGDIFVNGAWKTILVAGLGGGGRGYYALDITDPDSPVALWEFTDTDLGLTYGNPVITKRADGTWVVVFTSGYNNNVGGGDGNGHLYALNANTGAFANTAAGQPLKIPTYTSGTTPAGTPGTPSGLNKLNAWVDSPIDNTAKRFYGGDVLGNLWRFDIDGLLVPKEAALRLAQLTIGTTPQPITTEPQLAEITANGSKRVVVLVGTGKYLGTSDLSNQDRQSVYALKDSLGATGLGDVRAGGTLVTQTLTETVNANNQRIRRASSNPVDWSVKNGWMIDLPTAGERVNVDMLVQFNTLVVATNIPSSDACSVGGESWLFQLGLGTGGANASAPDQAVASFQGTAMTAGLSFMQLNSDPSGGSGGSGGGSGGSGGSSGAGGGGAGQICRNDIAGNINCMPLNPPSGSSGTPRRTSWRELAN
jgi:type IV pilus assembly protein PilY1